jgi:hypothetical protein
MKFLKITTMLAASATCAASLAFASPSEASTTLLGCTVTPKKPEIVGYILGGDYPVPIARYESSITCLANRSVRLTSEAYEQDNGKPGDAGGDDLIQRRVFDYNVGASSGSFVLRFDRPVPDWDAPDAWVELYHRVSYQVTVSGSTNAPTTWEKSTVLSTYARGTGET